MQTTIGEVLDKVDRIRLIVREIEGGCSIEDRVDDIADYLDEYINVLLDTKVHI